MREDVRKKLGDRAFLDKCLFLDGEKLIATPDGLYDYEGNSVPEDEQPWNIDEIETARKVMCNG